MWLYFIYWLALDMESPVEIGNKSSMWLHTIKLYPPHILFWK